MKNQQEGQLYFMKKDIWKRSFDFGIRITKMCQQIEQNQTSWIIQKQIIRSALSISANIAEGSGGSSTKEFIRYMDIARKSALETYNWLLCLEEIFTLSQKMTPIKQENVELVKILTTIVLNSKKNS